MKRINNPDGSRLVVTVDSPSGRRLLDVPLDARVADLVPSLFEACEGGTDPTATDHVIIELVEAERQTVARLIGRSSRSRELTR